VSYTLAKAVFAVAVFQDFNQTFLQGDNFGIVLTRSYTGTFSYALTPFIGTNLRASYSQNENTGVGNSAGSPNSDAFSGGAGLTWRLRPWLTLGLDYTYYRYNSSGTSSGAVSANQATVSLTGSF